ncbi:DNA-directed RNA polymerase II subunit RPB3 [Nematocida sp. LUAm3]|nr:DNA-directed RNA polymerase II subunit RPB3 [Nematocida sp. LUAm3]KAI5175719.1 DNA-directed RNA polymerase II subunit RPB3 [Nematocida sp. LUAm2]KAI5178625.1 DNA-directed RNA polymerase II subunit RPB3 [Nematocida sp. LUAm1]
MVKIEIQEVTEENIKFILLGTSLSFANALRRAMYTDIPTLAIDIVQFEKNYTGIPEEMTVDRLGLIPIESSTANKYQYPGDCGCKDYCSKCSIEISLNVENRTSTPRSITSKDFFVNKKGVQVGDPVYPSLITRLGLNQSIECKCIAVKGRGETHSKWSPVSAVAFGYDPQNKYRHTKYWSEQSVENEWPAPWYSDTQQVQDPSPVHGEEPSTFYFNVEVVRGCLTPMEVLTQAIIGLRERVQVVHGALEE